MNMKTLGAPKKLFYFDQIFMNSYISFSFNNLPNLPKTQSLTIYNSLLKTLTTESIRHESSNKNKCTR